MNETVVFTTSKIDNYDKSRMAYSDALGIYFTDHRERHIVDSLLQLRCPVCAQNKPGDTYPNLDLSHPRYKSTGLLSYSCAVKIFIAIVLS